MNSRGMKGQQRNERNADKVGKTLIKEEIMEVRLWELKYRELVTDNKVRNEEEHLS